MFCCSSMCWLGGITTFIIGLKLYVKSIIGRYNGIERLEGKTVVVTGANAGIGAITARDFAKRGARVIMVCRDLNKAEKVKQEIIKETGNTNLKIKHADYTSLTSVRKCAREILGEESQIDILLNNAGAAEISPKITEDGIDNLMQINYFAPFLFTNILLGKIKQSAPSRIVNVASIVHNIGDLDFETLIKPKKPFRIMVYGDSKMAIISFTNELARRLKGTGVTANSLHPGTFSSEITRYSNFFVKFMWHYVFDFFYRTPEEGAQTSIYCCVSPEVGKYSGEYFEECKLGRCKKLAKNEEAAKKLWQLSESAVKLKNDEKHY